MALQHPVPGAAITQQFGLPLASVSSLEPAMYYRGAERAWWQPFAGAAFAQHYHPGLDLAAGLGTPILACESGRVTFAGWHNNVDGYQLQVAINATAEYSFSHCSAVLVAAGQHVSRGQAVARIGQSGAATGPHTHWGVGTAEPPGNATWPTLWNPNLYLPGGALANDWRIRPLVAPPAPTPVLVAVNGPGINIRRTPDLTYASVWGISRADGIYTAAGARQGALTSAFAFVRWLRNAAGVWAQLRTGSGVTLYIYASLVHVVRGTAPAKP